MELKDKKYEEITCERIKVLIDKTKEQIAKTEENLNDYQETLAQIQYKRKEEEHLLKELEDMKASIPDFDEEIYKKYKAFFEKEIAAKNMISDIEIEHHSLVKTIEKETKTISTLKEQLAAWERQLDKFNSEK